MAELLSEEEFAQIRRRLMYITTPPWGRYGPKMVGACEAAEGQCIGSAANTEPVARFSGYLMPLEANVEFTIHAPADIANLLALVDAMRPVVKAAVKRLKTAKAVNRASTNENHSKAMDAFVNANQALGRITERWLASQAERKEVNSG